MNWSAVSYTLLSGGSAVVATGVQSVKIDKNANLLKFSGDGDRGPTLVVNDFSEPSADVETGDVQWVMGIPTGTPMTFTATHNDALLATAGAIVYTITPCVAVSPNSSGEHRQIGKGMISFQGYFSDGTTNPLSFTRS